MVYLTKVDRNQEFFTIDNSGINPKFLTLCLQELEEILSEHSFMKEHRSYLANLTNATSVDVDNQIF